MSLENQNISVDQLCHVIDLLNPTIDDYIYLCDFQHDFFIFHLMLLKDSQ